MTDAANVEPDEECQQLAGRLLFNVVMPLQLILLLKDAERESSSLTIAPTLQKPTRNDQTGQHRRCNGGHRDRGVASVAPGNIRGGSYPFNPTFNGPSH